MRCPSDQLILPNFSPCILLPKSESRHHFLCISSHHPSSDFVPIVSANHMIFVSFLEWRIMSFCQSEEKVVDAETNKLPGA